LETKKYCSAISLDVAQAFDRVQQPALFYKLKKILPASYFLFFQSYLNNRFFVTKVGSEISLIAPILAGVPQGTASSPFLYNLCTANQPTTSYTSVAEYADDKIIYTSQSDLYTAKLHLHNHLIAYLPGISTK